MSADTSNVTVTDDTDNHRFVATVAGEQAGFAVYHRTKGAVLVVHTEVGEAHQGEGVASELVRGMLDQLRDRDATVVPLCPYVRKWIDEHDEYQSLVDEDLDRALRP